MIHGGVWRVSLLPVLRETRMDCARPCNRGNLISRCRPAETSVGCVWCETWRRNITHFYHSRLSGAGELTRPPNRNPQLHNGIAFNFQSSPMLQLHTPYCRQSGREASVSRWTADSRKEECQKNEKESQRAPITGYQGLWQERLG